MVTIQDNLRPTVRTNPNRGQLIWFEKRAPVLLVCLALALASPARAETIIHRSETVEKSTSSRVIPVDCDEKSETVRIQFSARVDAGQIRWALIDPEGQVRLRGDGSEGKVSGDSGSLEPVRGRWELHVELEGFTGNYRIDGSAR